MDEVKRVLNRIAPGLPQFIELLTGRGIDELYTSGELKSVLEKLIGKEVAGIVMEVLEKHLNDE